VAVYLKAGFSALCCVVKLLCHVIIPLCSWADNDRYFSDEKAVQLALGNINVNTGERLADYDPDTAVKVCVM